MLLIDKIKRFLNKKMVCDISDQPLTKTIQVKEKAIIRRFILIKVLDQFGNVHIYERKENDDFLFIGFDLTDRIGDFRIKKYYDIDKAHWTLLSSFINSSIIDSQTKDFEIEQLVDKEVPIDYVENLSNEENEKKNNIEIKKEFGY